MLINADASTMCGVALPPDPADGAPRYTVAAVARRLGIAPATLRTWDRRYGMGPTDHQAGTRRRYSHADVARLELMRRLTVDGVAP
ncbi:MAG TPA: MerR family transcriptional regulator, partial [Frankiaceae bacterium]|nr:MerR family transcriptional regulator [Frankiaceae bacterium]